MDLLIELTPYAKSNSVAYQGTDLYGRPIYKCRLTAKPVDGQANRALIEFLSEEFGLPKRHITLIRGAKSRRKVVRVSSDDLPLPQ